MKAAYTELIVDGLKEGGFNFVASLWSAQLYVLEERLRHDPGVASQVQGARKFPGHLVQPFRQPSGNLAE